MRKRFERDSGLGVREQENPQGQMKHRHLVRVAEIDRPGEVARAVHQGDQAVDHVVDETEAAGLCPVFADGDRLVPQGLDDEIADDTPIVLIHARAVCVEDSCDLDLDAVMTPVVEKESFGTPLAFIIAGSDAVRIDVAPVGLLLRMLLGVPVDSRGRSLQDSCLVADREIQQIDGAVHRGLERVDRVGLVVDG